MNDVVERLNTEWAEFLGVRYRVLHWRSDVTPAVGESAQAVINSQIPAYDVYLAVLGARFGSPTAYAGSGTEEEFDIALRNHRACGSPADICVYFNNSSKRPLDIDAEQLARVQEFRRKLTGLGVLFRDCRSITELRRGVGRDLSSVLQRHARLLGRHGDPLREDWLRALRDRAERTVGKLGLVADRMAKPQRLFAELPNTLVAVAQMASLADAMEGEARDRLGEQAVALLSAKFEECAEATREARRAYTEVVPDALNFMDILLAGRVRFPDPRLDQLVAEAGRELSPMVESFKEVTAALREATFTIDPSGIPESLHRSFLVMQQEVALMVAELLFTINVAGGLVSKR